MRVQIRRGKQHVLRLDIHVDNAVPSVLLRRRLIGPITAIAEGVRHGVEDMPQKRFGKNKAVYALANDNHKKKHAGTK